MKNAVVIGAKGGIGSSLVKALITNGFKVIAIARAGVEISCDLTSYEQIKKAIQEIKKSVDKIDLLVNAAGVATYKNLADVSNEEVQEAFMVNVIAPGIFIRELSPLMKHKSSLVLNIGSGAGTTPMKGRIIYCATKYALRGLSLSLSEEYQDKYPKFCLITLGSTLTNFGPMTVEEKKREFEKGKAYFPVEWVINKLMEIIQDENRETEITLFPGDHGFGIWKKP